MMESLPPVLFDADKLPPCVKCSGNNIAIDENKNSSFICLDCLNTSTIKQWGVTHLKKEVNKMASNYTLQSVINTQNPIHLQPTGEPRTESNQPVNFRLANVKDGGVVLQGQFIWYEGFERTGYTWRTLPTVNIASASDIEEGVF